MQNPAKLSPRELEVELLSSYGASIKEMARVIGVEANTVKTYISNIRVKYQKIGLDRSKPYMMSPDQYDAHLRTILQKHRAQHSAHKNFGEIRYDTHE